MWPWHHMSTFYTNSLSQLRGGCWLNLQHLFVKSFFFISSSDHWGRVLQWWDHKTQHQLLCRSLDRGLLKCQTRCQSRWVIECFLINSHYGGAGPHGGDCCTGRSSSSEANVWPHPSERHSLELVLHQWCCDICVCVCVWEQACVCVHVSQWYQANGPVCFP